MWEIVREMAGDRLWIYTSIAGALLGAAFLAWFRDTRMGLWGYRKFDNALDYLVTRWGWTWLQEPDDIWRQRYPRITKKIDELEQRIIQLEANSHPSKELHEFEVYPELDARIKKLENESKD